MVKNKFTFAEYNKIKNQIEKLEDKIRKISSKQDKIRDVLVKKRILDLSKRMNPNVIITHVEKMYGALNNHHYPDGLDCSHFGMFSRTNIFTIDMSSHNLNQNYLSLVFQVKTGLKWVGNREIGCNQQTWTKLLNALKDKYTIIQYWNGQDGSTSMSVVIKRKVPKSLLSAQKNYHDQKSIGGNSGPRFHNLFDKYLKMELKK